MLHKIIRDADERSIITPDEMDSLLLPENSNDQAASVYGKVARLMKEDRGFDPLNIEELWIALLPLLLQETSSKAEYPIEPEKVLALIEIGAFDQLPENISIELLADLSGALAKKYM